MANPVGRPLKFKTVKAMQVMIDSYFENDAWFDNGEKREYRPTISGLAYALDIDRETLINYGKKEEFFGTVRKARQKVQMALENHLYGTAVTGAIFNLKNNFGWKDKTEVDNTIKLPDSVKINIVDGTGS